MRKFEKAGVDKVLSDIICDICGKSCIDEHSNWSANWGYSSHKDGETWDCDLCEDCSEKIREYIEIELGGRVDINTLW